MVSLNDRVAFYVMHVYLYFLSMMTSFVIFMFLVISSFFLHNYNFFDAKMDAQQRIAIIYLVRKKKTH